jgi:hypothetical protein
MRIKTSFRLTILCPFHHISNNNKKISKPAAKIIDRHSTNLSTLTHNRPKTNLQSRKAPLLPSNRYHQHELKSISKNSPPLELPEFDFRIRNRTPQKRACEETSSLCHESSSSSSHHGLSIKSMIQKDGLYERELRAKNRVDRPRFIQRIQLRDREPRCVPTSETRGY